MVDSEIKHTGNQMRPCTDRTCFSHELYKVENIPGSDPIIIGDCMWPCVKYTVQVHIIRKVISYHVAS